MQRPNSMELSYDESRSPYLTYKDVEREESEDKPVGTKMTELIKTKEELKKARESTMQLWLDSKPLIDELEILKSSLASAENRCAAPNSVIAELKSEIDAINTSIKAKKEDEQNVRMMIDETNQNLDQTRREIVSINLDTEEERKAILQLKQTVRLKRQTLRTLQLTLRAVRIEKAAVSASTTEALQYMNCSEMQNPTVTISLEDYPALTKLAEEENSLSDWRVLVCTEQKLAAESSRNHVLETLNELYSQQKSRAREIKEEDYDEDGGTPKFGNQGQLTKTNQNRVLAKPIRRNPKQQRRIRRENYMKMAANVKPTYLQQVRHFFASVCQIPK